MWWLYYGQNHKNGEIERRHILKVVNEIGDMPVTKLNKRVLLQHQSRQLSDGIGTSTINRDMYRLSGMFSTLIKLDEFKGENPMQGCRR